MSSGNASSTVLPAPVLWAQRKDRVYLTICLEDVQDKQLDLTESRLTFTGVGGVDRKPHSVIIDFFKAVDPQETHQQATGREIFISVRKKESGPYWPRLTADAVKRHWLKTDFKRWLDEDEVPELEEDFDAGEMTNLESKLTRMSDSGGFGDDLDLGNIGGGETDSDDDEEEEEEGEEIATKNGRHDGEEVKAEGGGNLQEAAEPPIGAE